MFVFVWKQQSNVVKNKKDKYDTIFERYKKPQRLKIVERKRKRYVGIMGAVVKLWHKLTLADGLSGSSPG